MAVALLIERGKGRAVVGPCPPPCRPLRLGGTIVPEAIDWEGGPLPLEAVGAPKQIIPYYSMAGGFGH